MNRLHLDFLSTTFIVNLCDLGTGVKFSPVPGPINLHLASLIYSRKTFFPTHVVVKVVFSRGEGGKFLFQGVSAKLSR